MSLAIRNPWADLAHLNPRSLPTSVGVFELADDRGDSLFVGYAGGRSPFGLRSEILLAAKTYRSATQVRYEVNINYLSRLSELEKLYVREISDPSA